MPLEPPDSLHLETAKGFVLLGMYLDADAELDTIDPFNRAAPEVLAIRIEIYRGLQKWELMEEISKRLNEFAPLHVQWILSYAFAARRSISLKAAKEILLGAVERLPKEATILFNLACYDCQLGDLDSAKGYLKRAFQIDARWRTRALDDEDLKPIWDSITSNF